MTDEDVEKSLDGGPSERVLRDHFVGCPVECFSYTPLILYFYLTPLNYITFQVKIL